MTRRTILLVDDDEDYLHIAERAVRREQVAVEVEVARNGGEALAKLGVGAPPPAGTELPAALFLDLNLPGIDGLEVLRRVRADERLARLPVVIISSSARSRDVTRCYELGANSYLVKHFDPGGPGRYIATAMRYWTELNCAPDARPRTT